MGNPAFQAGHEVDVIVVGHRGKQLEAPVGSHQPIQRQGQLTGTPELR